MRSRTRWILRAGLAALAAWLVLQLAFDFYPQRPGGVDRPVQLAPYHQGMSLREAFETFPAPEPGSGRTRLRLLADNDVAWVARWRLLEDARERLDISYFILEQDVIGVAFLGHLLRKAEQGVYVRVLLDAFGSKMSWHPKGNDYLDALVNTGNVEVRMYRPLVKRTLQGLFHLSTSVLLASEHDKILVADGRRSITGGRNIAVGYFADPEVFERAFRDAGVEVVDRAIAATLTRAFEAQFLTDQAAPISREQLNIQSQKRDLNWAYSLVDAWLHDRPLPADAAAEVRARGYGWIEQLQQLEHLRGALQRPMPPYLKAEARVLDSTVRFNAPDDPISEGISRLVRSARREIFVQNPYVALSTEAVALLAEASRRGVPMTLFTNSPASGDSAIMQAIFLRQWPWLLARVPTLRLYGSGEDDVLHAKLATFDRTVSVVGTYNLDPLSMAVNSEVVLVVWSRKFAEALTADARRRLERGPPVAYRYGIERHADGTPVLDGDGDPVARFGPTDHSDPQRWPALAAYLRIMEAAAAVGLSPFF